MDTLGYVVGPWLGLGDGLYDFIREFDFPSPREIDR